MQNNWGQGALMHFKELDHKMQAEMIELLNEHLATSAKILTQDRCLLPMLLIRDEINEIVALQPQCGVQDVDAAYEYAVRQLKNKNFTYALFSYSTRIGLASGNEVDALKVSIFTPAGIEVVFYTPYVRKGLFRKSVDIGKTLFAEMKENVFVS